MDGEEIQLVDHLVECEQLVLIETWPVDDLNHLRDHSAGQIASGGQLQPTFIGTSK